VVRLDVILLLIAFSATVRTTPAVAGGHGFHVSKKGPSFATEIN
jgi:hypothetical protein